MSITYSRLIKKCDVQRWIANLTSGLCSKDNIISFTWNFLSGGISQCFSSYIYIILFSITNTIIKTVKCMPVQFLFSVAYNEIGGVQRGEEGCMFASIPDICISVNFGKWLLSKFGKLDCIEYFKKRKREGTNFAGPLRSARAIFKLQCLGGRAQQSFPSFFVLCDGGELSLLGWRYPMEGLRKRSDQIPPNQCPPRSQQQHSGWHGSVRLKMLHQLSSCGFKEMDKIRFRPTCWV